MASVAPYSPYCLGHLIGAVLKRPEVSRDKAAVKSGLNISSSANISSLDTPEYSANDKTGEIDVHTVCRVVSIPPAANVSKK